MAATSLIPNKFLFYKTEAAFLEDLNKNFISDLSLVLVLDKRFIYSHGDYFYCNLSQDDCKILAQSLSSIDNKIAEIESVTSNALHKLEQGKVGKDEIDVEAIKNEIYNECNEIASKAVNDLIYKMQNMEVENATAYSRIIEMQQNVTLDVDLSIDENGNLIITY